MVTVRIWLREKKNGFQGLKTISDFVPDSLKHLKKNNTHLQWSLCTKIRTHPSVCGCRNELVSRCQIATSSSVCILNQISRCCFINSDKLTPDKPVVLSHFRGGISPWGWWVHSGSPGCERQAAMLLSEAWPEAPERITPSNGKLLSATKDIGLRGIRISPYLDLCTRQNEALYPMEGYFGIVISTGVDSD